MQKAEKDTISLVIKKQWFNAILSGKKTTEIREVRPQSASRYIRYVPDEELGEKVEIKPYKVMRLYMGYETDRPHFDIEILSAELIIVIDDKDQEIMYKYKGEMYVQTLIEYQLGSILRRCKC